MKERPTSPVEVASAAPAVPAAAKVARARAQSPPDVQGPLATLDELKEALPFKYRKKAAPAEVIEILSDNESDDKYVAKPSSSGALSLSRPPQMARRLPLPQRKISPGIDPAIPETDPTTVLERLAEFRNNLASALAKPSSTDKIASTHRDQQISENLPFVSRWVDYSRKHGIGYVLSDGTVGCIINATAKPDQAPTPVTHVLVRNGQRWLQKVGKNKEFAGIDQVPIEFFEDRDAEGIKRKVYKGLGGVKEGPLLVEAERRRTLSVLWVKFGRYMCQSLDGDESAPATGGENFVRFYQRIGCVGVWAFRDGSLQVSLLFTTPKPNE